MWPAANSTSPRRPSWRSGSATPERCGARVDRSACAAWPRGHAAHERRGRARRPSAGLGMFVQGLAFGAMAPSICGMPLAMNTSRTQVWLESLGEWSWPGRSAAAVEALPPSWVPAFPPRAELAGAGSAGIAAPGSWQSEWTLAPWLGTGALLSALAVLCAALVLNGPLSVERALGIRAAARPVATLTAQEAAASSPQALPTLVELSQDSAGSSVDTASYASAALN